MEQLLSKIISRGYWQIQITPLPFEQEKVTIDKLHPLLVQNVVWNTRWGFPYVKNSTQQYHWISQEFEWGEHKSVWHFDTAGQFIHVHGLQVDWLDEARISGDQRPPQPGTILDIADTVRTLTDIMSLASNLAFTDVGGQQMNIDLTLYHLAGRDLYHQELPTSFFGATYHQATNQQFQSQLCVGREELTTQRHKLALTEACKLFRCFGWEPPLDILQVWQHP